MKRYEIKSIGILSLFKFYTVLGFAISLIMLIVVILAGNFFNNLGLGINSNVFSLNICSNFLGGLLICLIYGIASGAVAVICGLIYNLFAAAIGGVIIKLRDEI